MSKVLTPILLLIASIGLFFTYIRPAYDVLLAFQAQEKELDNAIADTHALLKTYDDLLNAYSSIPPEDRARLEKTLPPSIDIVRLILDVDALATKHNINIRSFEIPQFDSKKKTSKSRQITETEESPIGSAILTMEVGGNYPDFKNLLLDIERSLSMMDVVELTVEVPDQTKPGVNDDDEIVYTLGLQTYWLK